MAVGGVGSGTIRKFTSLHLPLWSVFNLSTAETHPNFAFHQLPFSSTSIMPFIAPGTFAFFSKEYGEFSTGHFDPNRAYDPNSLGELSKWRKEFLDGRYGSKQPTPPSTPRSPSLSFPIPVIVGRQMFPGDDGYESEDDEILLPPPPIPPQIDPPSPNVPPMHVGQQRLPLRDLPHFDYRPQNVPEIAVGLIHDGHQPMPLRVLPQIAHRQLIFPAVRVQPMQQGQEPLPLSDMPQFDPPSPNVPAIRVHPVQQPIPLRDVQIFDNPPPNVPAVRFQPMPQPMPLRGMPQIHHPPRNPIQPRQQRLPLRDGPQFDHPLPNGPPIHPNPPRVLEVIRRLREWRGRPQDPRRLPQ
ncbi:hypothetical protein niasHT_037107 [Heterodera trifolii]|uniref:Uncharacterized protein n=1 Tax=Heterodera trifolii TaxID=157864 RepID=A0ABD2IQJ1_9BILA